MLPGAHRAGECKQRLCTYTHTKRTNKQTNLHLVMKRRDFHQVPADVSTHLPVYAGFQKGYRIDWGRSSRPKLTAALRSLS